MLLLPQLLQVNMRTSIRQLFQSMISDVSPLIIIPASFLSYSIQFGSIVMCTSEQAVIALSWAHTPVINWVVCLGQNVRR